MINDQLDNAASLYLSELRSQRDELVVPLELWRSHIEGNPRIEHDDVPPHKICGNFVITEREWFGGVVADLKYLYYQPKRLTRAQGGFWFVEKLERKRTMPKHDIFDAGLRQPGSFRSKG